MATPASPATHRLYLEEPRAKTALARVAGHASGGFLLDRTLYHAPDKRYHHHQPEDRGHVLAEGHKLKLDRVFRDDHARLVHRTGGPLPAVGAKAQLFLDAPRREQQARAHALLHLLLAAHRDHRAELLEMPRVVGNGEVRLHARYRDAPDAAAADVLANVQRRIAARTPVVASWHPRDDAARRAAPQPVPLDDVAPDEPVLRLVAIGDDCAYPCDAPLVERASDVGDVRRALWQPRGDSVRWGIRVL